MAMHDTALADLLIKRPRLIVFLPNTNELQRFVLSGAFDNLGQDHELHFVVAPADRAKMQAAAPALLRDDNTHELDVPPERFAKWSKLFGLACAELGSRSRSFAIRANVESLDPRKAAFWQLVPEPAGRLISKAALRLTRREELPISIRRRLTALANALGTDAPLMGKSRDLERRYSVAAAAILNEMEPLPEISELFDRLQPLGAVIPTSLLDLFCNDVLLACEREQVACLLIQSGWDNMSSKGIIHHAPTLTGAWGPQSARHARTIQGIVKHTVKSLGAPHYEFLKPAAPREITGMRKTLGVQKGDRLVLFGGSFRQFDETAALIRLDAAIEDGELPATKIVYRPHPWRADRQDEDDFFQHEWKHVVFDPDMQERYVRAREEKGYLKKNVPMYDMSYLACLLSTVDAVISPMSTLLLEALIMKRSTMAIAFGDGKHAHNPSVTAQMTHFKELKNTPALVWCDDEAKFVAQVGTMLSSVGRGQNKAARRKLLADLIVQEPGTYGERLGELCRETFDPVARKMRAVRAAHQRVHISHAYGADLIVRDYCRLEVKHPKIPGYWMHGWIPAYHNEHYALIALHKKDGQGAGYDFESQIAHEKEHVQQWVARRDQADFLIDNGYKRVEAIGLPILYINQEPVKRVPGSLLVMPPHSHRNHGVDDPIAEEYAEHIAGMKDRFSEIWVALHEDDIAKRQWIDSFRSRGISVFPSADQSDPHTLRRLRHIMSSFEYVTTNGYGSHIGLAAFCGAKTSVWGPYAEFPHDRMARTHAVKMFPELRDKAYELCTEKALKTAFPFLFVEPDKAELLIDWGFEQVGGPCKKSPEELRALFGWAGSPHRESVKAKVNA